MAASSVRFNSHRQQCGEATEECLQDNRQGGKELEKNCLLDITYDIGTHLCVSCLNINSTEGFSKNLIIEEFHF